MPHQKQTNIFMPQHKFTIQRVINVVLICALIILLFFQFFRQNTKVVYIDSAKLFEGFAMTKEMKRVGEKEFNSRKSALDSLYSFLQNSSVTGVQKEQLMQDFIRRKDEFEKFNQSYPQEQTSKIWSRIKSYTSEFSKDKKYQLVIGSDNQQMVLFADEKIDVTDELLTYLNKKYEGI